MNKKMVWLKGYIADIVNEYELSPKQIIGKREFNRVIENEISFFDMKELVLSEREGE